MDGGRNHARASQGELELPRTPWAGNLGLTRVPSVIGSVLVDTRPRTCPCVCVCPLDVIAHCEKICYTKHILKKLPACPFKQTVARPPPGQRRLFKIHHRSPSPSQGPRGCEEPGRLKVDLDPSIFFFPPTTHFLFQSQDGECKAEKYSTLRQRKGLIWRGEK